jgi:hypothetical protein
VPIDKPWLDGRGLKASELPGTVGVYELGDADGVTIFIGYAGGRSLFGLRGVIGAHFGGDEPNPVIRERLTRFRYEVTTSYLTRQLDLLSRFNADHGGLPDANVLSSDALPPLARFHS